ncbi:MAG: flagellar hook-length control protein FliK [Dehalococcoidia bacterium]
MAIDAIAMPGAPPIAAGPPETPVAAGSPSGDGKTFSDVIASAMEQPAAPAEGAKTAAEVVAPPMPAVDLAALLVDGDATFDGDQQVAPITLDLRPDRDAGAEDVTAALAALMFGGVLPRPIAATEPTAGGIASTPVAAVAAATTTLPLTAASEAPAAAAAAPVIAAVAAAAPESASVQLDGPVSEYGWRPTSATKPATAPQATPAVEVAPVDAPVVAAQAPAPRLDADASEAAAASTEQPIEITSVAAEAVEAAPEPREPRAERTDDTTGLTPFASTVVEARAPQVTETSTTLTVDAADGPQLASNIADTVQAAALRDERELRIAINPPDLGQLTVHITEHAEGGVTVAIQASSSEAHDLLQQHLPALRTGLEQRDVRVERLHVEQQAPSAGLGWADGGQQRSNGGRDAWASRDESPWSPIAAMGGVRSTAASTSRGPAEAGRVDLRA